MYEPCKGSYICMPVAYYVSILFSTIRQSLLENGMYKKTYYEIHACTYVYLHTCLISLGARHLVLNGMGLLHLYGHLAIVVTTSVAEPRQA